MGWVDDDFPQRRLGLFARSVRSNAWLAALLFATACGHPPPPSPSPPARSDAPSTPEPIQLEDGSWAQPGEILLVVREGFAPTSIAGRACTVVRWAATTVVAVRCEGATDADTTAALIEAAANVDGVRSAEPNRVRTLRE